MLAPTMVYAGEGGRVVGSTEWIRPRGELRVRLPSEFKNAFERWMEGKSSPAKGAAKQPVDDDGDGL